MEAAKKKTQIPVPRVSIPSKKRNNQTYIRRRLTTSALTWLAENLGCAIFFGGPGQRSGIHGVHQYLVTQYGVVLSSRMTVTA